MARTPYVPEELPLKQEQINPLLFIRELIEANKKVAQYQVLLETSKLPSQLL
ncbi:hypothetical protein [Paenibacillus sp. A3]|uniref:hypothetical protein n=1 Tax=Paenibacillus sp. A3 TaxID=1337054 RepID=UPI000A6ED113|nr:hypothetical protein [Paenibacillus sp. A3]